MFDGPSLGDVLVYELPANGVQEPPTDGSVASSTLPTRDPESLHKAFGDVHQPGTCQAANKGREKQSHGTSLLAVMRFTASPALPTARPNLSLTLPVSGGPPTTMHDNAKERLRGGPSAALGG